MKIGDLKNRSREELSALLIELREKMRVLKFDLAQGKVKNTNSLHQTKKDIARILTFLNSQ